MQVQQILTELDQEISRLQQARSLLAGEPSRRGRPRGSGTKSAAKKAATPGRKTRKMSAEGRQRIAEAMKRRWADRKKAESK